MISIPQFTTGIPPGILLSSLITLLVAGVSVVLSIFLLSRWRRLDHVRRQFALFWPLTAVLWFGVSLRHLMLFGNFADPTVYYLNEMGLQLCAFLSGVPLMRYLAIALFRSRVIVFALTAYVVVGASMAFYFLLGPLGLDENIITPYSVEGNINTTSALIFSIMAGSILLLLLGHIFLRLWQWLRGSIATPYDAFYSVSLGAYLILGSADQLNIVSGWGTLVIRVLYVAAFFIAYLVVSEDERRREQYLVEERVGIAT